jgi:hypothetical protein
MQVVVWRDGVSQRGTLGREFQADVVIPFPEALLMEA